VCSNIAKFLTLSQKHALKEGFGFNNFQLKQEQVIVSKPGTPMGLTRDVHVKFFMLIHYTVDTS